ncbi:MAG: TDP-N-acetylfucosamine:lipid II N-acetylfucosaminyltransferase [Pseudomonadales bacterium]
MVGVGDKILHICELDKFIPPFMSVVRAEFEQQNHMFITIGDLSKYPYAESHDSKHYSNFSLSKSELVRRCSSADKILLHGIYMAPLTRFLFWRPWLLAKCYWVLWGGDLYEYMRSPRSKRWYLNEFYRRFVIKRIGFIVTYIRGDYDLAVKWYKARGKLLYCLMYPSNTYVARCLSQPIGDGRTIKILVGNSADPRNNHMEALAKLKFYSGQDIEIYVPLSYGSQKYADKVVDYGVQTFGDSFIPMRHMLAMDDYYEFLSSIDIAIFNHEIQQAMGNTITLLGMGKKVYLRANTTSCSLLESLGIKVHSLAELNLKPISAADAQTNEGIIRRGFGADDLVSQLSVIFEG